MELVGEYTGPDGQPQELRAPCDAPVAADPYQSLLAGMARMRDLVNELVEASQDLMASPDSDEDSDGTGLSPAECGDCDSAPVPEERPDW